MTPKSKKFAEINASRLIVEMGRRSMGVRTPNGLRFRFEGGQQITLQPEDLAALDAANIPRRWKGPHGAIIEHTSHKTQMFE